MTGNPRIQKFYVTKISGNKALANTVCVFLSYLGLFVLCIGYAILGTVTAKTKVITECFYCLSIFLYFGPMIA